METNPTAPYCYSSKYSFDYNSENLSEIKENYYTTHTSYFGECLHTASEYIIIPALISLNFFARIIEPLPGENKDHFLWGVAVRVTCVVFFILSIPFAVASFLLYLPVRLLDHSYRREISFLDNSDQVTPKDPPSLTHDNPLHIRTHNTGLLSSYMSTIGDLRPPIDRAKELLESIETDPHHPDIISFQEVFDEEARAILIEGLKKIYPFVIYNIAEDPVARMSCGYLVVSKHPIDQVSYQMLDHMMGPERLTHRGILQFNLKTSSGENLSLFTTHIQALIGSDRADARYKQLQEIRQFLEEKEEGHQIFLGDFNVCSMTAWGEDQTTPTSQAEEQNINYLQSEYTDLFHIDHNPEDGKRISGEPKYLSEDNIRMGLQGNDLEEPTGSWYHGPFLNGPKGYLIRRKMQRDRNIHKKPEPRVDVTLKDQEVTWGTKKWHATQKANTSRFDRFLIPKTRNTLTGRIESRRVVVKDDKQSPPSDHLPVDACIWAR